VTGCDTDIELAFGLVSGLYLEFKLHTTDIMLTHYHLTIHRYFFIASNC